MTLGSRTFHSLLRYLRGLAKGDAQMTVEGGRPVTPCGETSLRHALTQHVAHVHHERHHQGKGNVLLFPAVSQDAACQGPVQCRERLGGLLKDYAREAARVF